MITEVQMRTSNACNNVKSWESQDNMFIYVLYVSRWDLKLKCELDVEWNLAIMNWIELWHDFNLMFKYAIEVKIVAWFLRNWIVNWFLCLIL